jgi:hypothetical protein
MKTKNNVQKAGLRTIAVIVSFVLISLTVTAQGFWKQLLTNNSFNHLATALVEHRSVSPEEEAPKENSRDTGSDADIFYEETEEELALEPWMFVTVK